MSDNGLIADKELLLEVIDVFGLDASALQSFEDSYHSINNRVQKTAMLR